MWRSPGFRCAHQSGDLSMTKDTNYKLQTMKKVSRVTSLVLAGFLTSSLLLPLSVANAQTSPIDLSLSPPTTYLQVTPGKTVTHTVILEQHGSAPLEITPQIVDFTSDGSTGAPQLELTKSPSFTHLTIQTAPLQLGQSFVLNPGQKKQIVFAISPPANSPQAEYPLTLLFVAKPAQALTITTGSQVSGIIGSNLIVFVSANAEDKGKVSLKEIQTPRLVDSFGALAFSLLAENEGRNATTASGSALIKDWRNETVAEYEVYPDMILAQTTRLLRTGTSLEEDDTDLLSTDFRYKPIFLFGPYTISAQLAENGQTDDFNSVISVTVFAFPYSLVILLMLGSALYGTYKYMITREKVL